MATFSADLAYDKTNTFFNTDEFARSGTGYAPGSDTAVPFKYLQRDLPDTDTVERRELWVDADLVAVTKGYRITTDDSKAWRVVSTGTDERGKTLVELERPLTED